MYNKNNNNNNNNNNINNEVDRPQHVELCRVQALLPVCRSKVFQLCAKYVYEPLGKYAFNGYGGALHGRQEPHTCYQQKRMETHH